MPSLVGTNPNQVPTNADLGTMAFQDKEAVNIEGGVINNTPIGSTTPAAGAFTTLSATGNTTLGDASTDTVTVKGYVGIGRAGVSLAGVYVTSSELTGTAQIGIYSTPTGSSTATSQINGFTALPKTAGATFTVSSVSGFRAENATLGASSTITDQHGLYVSDLTSGANNFGVRSAISSGANKWNVYASGTANNYFAGNVGVGTTTPAAQVHIQSSTGGTLRLSNSSTSVGAGASLGGVDWYSNDTSGSGSGVRGYIASIETDGGLGRAYSLTFGTGNVTEATEKMRVTPTGNLLIGTTTDDGANKLQVNGTAKATQWNVSAMATAPASATATGTLGEVRVTATHIYVCTATNTWVRAALSTWA